MSVSIRCWRWLMAMAVDVINGKEEITDGPQAGVVGLGAIVDDGQGLGIVLLAGPLFKDGGELMISDDDVFIDIGDGIDVVQHTAEDCVVTNLQQGFGEVLGQLTQASGVTGGDDDGFHVSFFRSVGGSSDATLWSVDDSDATLHKECRSAEVQECRQ